MVEVGVLRTLDEVVARLDMLVRDLEPGVFKKPSARATITQLIKTARKWVAV